jgi:Ca-activated chloride channel family protein
VNTVETVSLDRATYRGPNIFSDAIRGLMLVVSNAIVISLSLALIVMGLTALSGEARAEKPNPVNSVESGSLLIKVMPGGKYVSAPLVSTEVELNVSGIVSRAKVIQYFKNDSQDWVEGKYVFPLPENSAVDKLRMRIGERVIEGQIKERGQAKKEFEKAAKEGKQASLIEQQRPNIFTSRVTNIAPGETIIVEIEYQNTLIYRDGLVGLRFPLVVGPRYIPAIQRGDTNIESAPIDPEVAKDAYEISPLVIAKGEPLRNPVSIKLRVDAGFPIEELRSTNHAIKKTKISDNVYEVTLMEPTVPADRDFEVSWTAADGNMPNSSIFTERTGDKNYALITLFPPKTVHKTLSRMPRDVVFVVDTSGSMSGTSLEQAKNALNLAVRRLHKSDRFNIIQFNTYTSSLFDKEIWL